MQRLTDKRAVQIALGIAIDTEEGLIDAYAGDKTEPAVQQAQKNIDAFRRVLERYYGSRKSLSELWDEKYRTSETIDAYRLSAQLAAEQNPAAKR